MDEHKDEMLSLVTAVRLQLEYRSTKDAGRRRIYVVGGLDVVSSSLGRSEVAGLFQYLSAFHRSDIGFAANQRTYRSAKRAAAELEFPYLAD